MHTYFNISNLYNALRGTFKYCVMWVIAMCAISCSNEQSVQETVQVTINAGIDAQSRADNQSTNVNKLTCVVYYNGNELPKLRTTLSVENGIVIGAFKPELIPGRTYTFAFWAYTEGAYNINDFTAITRTGTKEGAYCDAFTNYATATITQAQELSITLNRPFAQLNILANAIDWRTVTSAGKTPETAKVTLNCYSAYNAVSGEGCNIATNTYTSIIDATVGSTTYKTLFSDFILLAPSQDKVSFSYEIESQTEEVITTKTISDVPAQINYKTNVIVPLN